MGVSSNDTKDVFSNEKQVKILLEEYKLFREEILQNISSYQKNIYIFGGIVLLLFGLGFEEEINLIFVILPFVLATWHLLIMDSYRWLHKLANYTQVIEEKINMLLAIDYKIMCWEHLARGWTQEIPLYPTIYYLVVYVPIMLLYAYSAHVGAQFMHARWYYEFISVYNVSIFIYSILFIYCIVVTRDIVKYNDEILRTEIKSKMNLQPQTTTQNKQ